MNTKDLKRVLLFVCGLFSLVLYGLGVEIIYQPDIYGRVSATSDLLFSQIVNRDGRILNMIILYLLHRGSFASFYYVSVAIGILLVAFATYKYSFFLIKNIYGSSINDINPASAVIIVVLSCITIANMFSAEFFLYIDMTVAFTLGIFLSTEAAVLFVDSMSNAKLVNFQAFICLLAVAFLYETISSLFIVLTVPFVLLSVTSFLDFIKKQVAAGLHYGLPLIIKTLFTKIVINSERAQFDRPSFSETAASVAPEGMDPGVYIFDRITFGMWSYVLLSLVILIVFLVFVIRKKRYLEIVKVIYLSCVVIIAGTVPFILRLTNDYKPRIYYPLGAYFGVLCTYGIIIGVFNPRYNNVKERVLNTGIVVIAIVQYLSFVQMYAESYITNYEDKYISEMIGATIDKYESETGNKVEYITFYDDAVRTKYSTMGWCLIQRAYSSWGDLDALNMYLGRDYRKGTVDNEIADYFISRDWNCFSNDQVIIKGDTAHVCEY